MISYVNSFRCARSESGQEVLISFHQEAPIFRESGAIEGVSSSLVASIFLREDTVDKLIAVLQQLKATDPDKVTFR